MSDEADFVDILAPIEELVFEEQEPQQHDFTPLKHTWKTYEDGSGAIDISAGVDADYHNGPLCTECGYAECHHCRDVYSDTSCAYQKAWDEWFARKLKAEKKNEEIAIINRYLAELRVQYGSPQAYLPQSQEHRNTAVPK